MLHNFSEYASGSIQDIIGYEYSLFNSHAINTYLFYQNITLKTLKTLYMV